MTLTTRSRLLALAASTLLAACGGGGSGGNDATTTTPAPQAGTSAADSGYAVATALKQAFETGFTTTVRGPQPGTPDVTLQLVIGLAGKRIFEGTERDLVRYATTRTVPGSASTTSSVDHPYDLSTMTRWGGLFISGGYSVFSPAVALPAQATPGDRGTLGVATTWADATKSGASNVQAIDWTLEAIDAASAWFCTVSTLTAGDGSSTGSQVCYKLVKTGAGTVPQLSGMKLVTTYAAPGQTTQTYVQQ